MEEERFSVQMEFSLSPELKDRLTEASEARGVSMATLCRLGVELVIFDTIAVIEVDNG